MKDRIDFRHSLFSTNKKKTKYEASKTKKIKIYDTQC